MTENKLMSWKDFTRTEEYKTLMEWTELLSRIRQITGRENIQVQDLNRNFVLLNAILMLKGGSNPTNVNNKLDEEFVKKTEFDELRNKFNVIYSAANEVLMKRGKPGTIGSKIGMEKVLEIVRLRKSEKLTLTKIKERVGVSLGEIHKIIKNAV